MFAHRALFSLRVVAPLAAAVLAVGIWSVASAHANPVATFPTAGAVINVLPAEVSMDTSQALAASSGSDLIVVDAAGKQVTTTSAVVDPSNNKHLSVPLPSSLSAGTYTVRWFTDSAEDGETASGSWSFTYAPAQGTATATASPAATATAAPPSTASPVAPPTTVAPRTPTAVAAASTPSAPQTGMGVSAGSPASAGTVLVFLSAAVALSVGARLSVTFTRRQ